MRIDTSLPFANTQFNTENAMSEDRDIDVSHDVASFVSELRRLADALEHRTEFTIHIDGEDVTVPDGAKFSVAHESEAGENELEFQITWSISSEDDEDEADAENDKASDDDNDDQKPVDVAASVAAPN
jgi:amphi-Trp domain-containing protein